jgi:hypothetical protein
VRDDLPFPDTYFDQMGSVGGGDDYVQRGYASTFTGHANTRCNRNVEWLGRRGEYVVCGSDGGHLMVWRAADGALVKVLEGPQEPVTCVKVSGLPAGVAVIGLRAGLASMADDDKLQPVLPWCLSIHLGYFRQLWAASHVYKGWVREPWGRRGSRAAANGQSVGWRGWVRGSCTAHCRPSPRLFLFRCMCHHVYGPNTRHLCTLFMASHCSFLTLPACGTCLPQSKHTPGVDTPHGLTLLPSHLACLPATPFHHCRPTPASSCCWPPAPRSL